MFPKLLARRGLSFDRLHNFLQVAVAGGIAKAVGTDPVKQSQFSRQIKELEEFFGVPLLRRSGKRLALTPAGERLTRVGHEAFLGLADFKDSCEDEPVQFTIGAGDSLIQWLVLPRLGALQRSFPKVTFRVRNMRSRDVLNGLRELRVDFGLVRRDAVGEGIKSTPLGMLDYALYVPRGLLPGRRKRDFAWVIENVPVTSLVGDGQFRARLDAIEKKLNTTLKFPLECESFPHAWSALESGHYAAILPQLAVAKVRRREFVEIAPPSIDHPRRSVVLAWNPRLLRLRETASALREKLAAVLKF